jgi:hypothetical protein
MSGLLALDDILLKIYKYIVYRGASNVGFQMGQQPCGSLAQETR